MKTKDNYEYFTIKPTYRCEFRECKICKNPYVFDGTLNNCLWCEINKEKKDDD